MVIDKGFAFLAWFIIPLLSSYLLSFARVIHKSIYFGKHFTAFSNKILAYASSSNSINYCHKRIEVGFFSKPFFNIFDFVYLLFYESCMAAYNHNLSL